MVDANGQTIPAATIKAMGADAAKVVLDMGLTTDQQATVIGQVRDQLAQQQALGIPAHWHDGFMAVVAERSRPTCPACGVGGELTDDPQVLKCTGCGGIFTDQPISPEQAIKFVAIHLPMIANAGQDGQFYFDLELTGGRLDGRRVHGWADRKTKRVVQWG